MIKTDIFDRGVPWTRLILRAGQMPNDLNLRWAQRASVMLSVLSVAALASGSCRMAIACAFGLLCFNLPFLSFLWKKRGAWFVINTLPIHFLFHFCSGIAFGIGLVSHVLAIFRAGQSEATTEEAS